MHTSSHSYTSDAELHTDSQIEIDKCSILFIPTCSLVDETIWLEEQRFVCKCLEPFEDIIEKQKKSISVQFHIQKEVLCFACRRLAV